ncbi:hypothetical protein [Roseivirga misakiensis]|uniref:Uncharacterized protein n=1 Tax=Roseivirga misakiensis TaxID=1563681 RepID=A0A1E5SL29_9BACT|nr:hypothetical protein [Roseivirga misakiensis]OEJ99835.1 hypothetical protein BFP71_09805 [Roseivirga misakiensis]
MSELQDSNQKSNKVRLKESAEGIQAFYEKLIYKVPGTTKYAQLLIASVGLTVVSYGIHLCLSLNTVDSIFDDYSFLLSIMHGFCLFVLTYATWRIKRYAVELTDLVSVEYFQNEVYLETSIKFLKRNVGGFGLVPWGLFFAILNLFVGFLFGPYYNTASLILSIHIQHFLIGFLCGMAVGGIYAILVMTHRTSLLKLRLNFYHPDKCCGTSSIGNLLFTFALITLAMAVLVSSYISLSWDHNRFVPVKEFVYWFWVAWPYLLSVIVFGFPILKIHSKLKRYKEQEHFALRKKLRSVDQKLIDLDYQNEKAMEEAEKLIAYSEKLKGIDETIDAASSWPYTKGQTGTFFSIFPVTTIASTEVSEYINDALTNAGIGS